MCTGAEIAILASMAAGTAISVNQQNKMANFQEAQAKQSAVEETQAGELRAEQARERAKRIAASARANMAASGVNIDSVTSNLINKDIIARGEKDAFTETLNAADRATALRQQADVFNLQGRQAVTAGVVNLATSAIATGARRDGSWYGRGGQAS